MTDRPFEIETGGTAEISDDGELRIFNDKGEKVAGIKPDGPLWCYIQAKASDQVKKRLLAIRR